MAKLFIFIFRFTVFLFLANTSKAAELYELNTSVRALGMGNAYTSVVRDSDAVFYNPAAIGLNSGVYWTVADPRVGLNGLDAYDDIQAFQDSGDFAQALTNLSGKRYWAGAGAKSIFRMPYFMAGVYDSLDSSVAINDPSNPLLEANFINDFGFVAGVGAEILPFVYLGVAAKYITRTGNRTTFDSTQIPTLDFDTFDAAFSNKGTGIALDAGLTISIDTPINPAISFVVKNIGNTTFEADGNDPAPPTDEQEMIAGASITTDLGLISVTPAIDVKYLDNSDIKFGQKLHIGVDVGLPLVDIRAGLHQSYWTLGASFGFGPFQFDAASYGVELGDSDNKVEDRRYMVQATIEFGLDLGLFGSSGSGSGKDKDTRKRRRVRLKQRR